MRKRREFMYVCMHPQPINLFTGDAPEIYSKERLTAVILRLLCMAFLVAGLTLHVRSLKIFKWEQSVSGGVLVTYLVAVVGLTLCSGSNKCYGTSIQVLQVFLFVGEVMS